MGDYSLLPGEVPVEAVTSRFPDHWSYFTMLFDHSHDLVSDDERRRGFAFMAQDLADLGTRVSTLESLRAAVADGQFRSAYVSRHLR